MNRKSYPTLSLLMPAGAIGLLVLLLTMAVVLQPTTFAAGNTIKVPDDYTTIQAAIDAAASGDTIQVVVGSYDENLFIDKAITLSGGWNISFTEQELGYSVIDANGSGRVISVTAATSDTVVTISGFTIQGGDATGLGGTPAEANDGLELPSRFTTTVSAASMDIAHEIEMLSSRAVAIADGSFCSGGSSGCQYMLQMVLDNLQALESSQIQGVSAEGVQEDTQVDCGGGIYSYNASLKLFDSIIIDNVASTDSNGSGGGVCIWQSPPGGSVIERTTFHENIASTTGIKSGFGGGLYVLQAPGIVIEDSKFVLNTASDAGLFSTGVGGGLMIWESPGSVVTGNQIERNTANAGTITLYGLGGGAYIGWSDGITVTNNVIRNNLATVYGTCAGGGLMINSASSVMLADNQLIENWACMFAMDRAGSGGGGASLYGMGYVTMANNTFKDNTAVVAGADVGFTVGGGLDGENWREGAEITSNTFDGNVAAGSGEGRGGGASLWAVSGAEIKNNDFISNVGNMSTGNGIGGGLYLLNDDSTEVRSNRFQGNLGSHGEWGVGGGLSVREEGPQSFDLTVDSNIFLDNQSGSTPSAMYDGSACEIGVRDVVFINNLIVGNQEGSAVYLPYARGITLVNNTLVDHKGAAILVDEWNTRPITFTNNIIANSTVGISVATGVTAVVQYTLWDGNVQDIAGDGTITHTHPVTGSAAFRDPTNDDYHLTITSTAINTGDPAGVPPAPSHDLDGVPRPQGEYVDIGAYELQGSWLYLPEMDKAPDPPADRSGWAIGEGKEFGTAAIVHTDNGGKSWETQGVWQNSDPGDISAVDDLTAWAAFASSDISIGGAILKTSDGGATWISQTLPISIPFGIKGIKGLSQEEAWAASLDGIILHTTDGGANWIVVPHDTAPITQVNRMDAMGSNVWIADASDTGAVVHSTDGGATWRSEFLPDGDNPLTVHAFSPTIVWGSGQVKSLNPTFYRTVNGGDQWDAIQTVGALDHLDDVCSAGEKYAWGVVNGDAIDGQIFRVHPTSTGELIADKVTPSGLLGLSPGGVSCLDTQIAWVVAFRSIFYDPNESSGLIFYTNDGGESWAQQIAPTDVKYWKVSFVGALR